MCFPSVSAQGYWCSRWNVQFLPISACFSHLGSLWLHCSPQMQSYFCAKWQFSTQTADAGFSCNGTHTERVGDSKHTLDNLSSCFGQFSVQQTVQILSIATACRSLPACLLCQHLGGHRQYWWGPGCVPSNKGRWRVSRKMQKRNWDWKHSLTVYLPYVSSWLILLVNIVGRAVGMGHFFLLLDIKEYDVGQYSGSSRLFTFTDAVFPSWFVNKLY